MMRRTAVTLGLVGLGVAFYAVLQVNAAGPPPGDHYMCYKAILAKGQPKFVQSSKNLKDQFGGPTAHDVKKILQICNPADKNGSVVSHPLVHELGLQIKLPKGAPKFVKSNHQTVDQFAASRNLTVTAPDSLLDVSAKVLGTTPPGPLASNEGVDRYKCYKATLAKGSPKFTAPPSPLVKDEIFPGGQVYDIKKVTRLCNPVDKNGETPGAETHTGHLVCYQAKLPKGSPKFVKPTVAVNSSNFGAFVLTVTAPAELCLPALKDPPPTTTTSTTTTTTTTTLVVHIQGVLPATIGRFNYNLVLGLPGAGSACNSNFPSSHVCTYPELQTVEAQSELVGIKDINNITVTSFWAVDSTQPPLQQCNDAAGSALNWEYGTAHTASRGQRVTLTNPAGTLGPLQSSVQCNIAGTSWVGCCQ